MLSYSAHEAGGIMIFTVEEPEGGEAPLNQREWLYHTIEQREDPRFAIDLGEINYLASSDIGFLVMLKRRIDLRKGKVALFRLDPYIVDIFRTMRIDKLFLFGTDLNDVIAKLSQPEA
jgi:anti-sigma B factor antagonist